MNKTLMLTTLLLPVLAACGGGGDGDAKSKITGTFTSTAGPVKSNGPDSYDDRGPQHVYGRYGNPDSAVEGARIASWPGLRFGDFLLTNNPWNGSAASYESWYQTISLSQQGGGLPATIDWDWGASNDTNGSQFNTKSYPEVIYGTKSAAETSGDFESTGLPTPHYSMPAWTIDYGYTYQGRRSSSPTGGGTDSEFNIAIESFYHDSCDIVRTGSPEDNQVMEVMVWLKHGDRLPSGQSPHAVPFTSSDGRVYDVYAKNGNFGYIAYVARQEQNTGQVLYGEILHDAKDNAGVYGVYEIKDTDCLANILFGTEIWHGAGTFTLTDYQITRTY